jgi:energy-coupling factor transport system ATP-binding protein
MMKPEPAVLIRDLSFRYPKTVSGRSVTALRTINLRIEPGELVVITGPSGSGKSSLCRCFNGLIPHATKGLMGGDVIIHGMNTRDHEVSEFAPHVGLVFQDPDYQLITGDVANEIAFGLETLGLPLKEIERELGKWADTLHFRHLIGRSIRDLSWGERQRVAIASVLAMHPSLLVMDEPFSGIDTSAGQVLCDAIKKIRKETNTTVIIFEHRLSLLKGIVDRLVVLDDGEVSFDGPLSAANFPQHETRFCREGNEYCSPEKWHKEGIPVGRRDPVAHPVNPKVSFRQVHFRYPGADAATLDGITLDFYPNEITVISGPNGSGKTTLLKLCNGLLHPDSGEVLVQGIPVGNRTVATLTGMVGLLCQHADFQLFESTITDELSFAPKNLKMSQDEITRRMVTVVRECVLDRIDLKTPPLGLSGGEKQRVAIAGLFMMDTPVVVLDEPTFGLDYDLKRALAAVLGKMRDHKKTVIVATHDEEFAALCADRYIGIAAGRLVNEYRVNRDVHVRNPSSPESGRQAGIERGCFLG